MEAEAREMSRLAAKATDMSQCTAEEARMSRRAAEAAGRSRRAAAAWEISSRAGEDSYRRMHAIVHSQMDQISGWARLQDDMKASFEQATCVIRQLREGNERLRAERDLLREKIVRSTD